MRTGRYRMVTLNPATALFLAVLVCGTAPCHAAPGTNLITRLNQTEAGCKLVVNVEGKGDWKNFSIVIPKDDPRLKRLFRVKYVIGKERKPDPLQARVPIQLKELPDGGRHLTLGIRSALLADSFIEFDCFWEDIRLSSMDICFLDLSSYVEDEKEK